MIAGILMIKWIVEVLTYVVTHFWAPRAGDGVYLFWTKCRSLVHDCWGIDKSREKKKCFPNPVSAVFYSLYSPPFATKIIRFLRLIRCLYNANSFLFIWPLRLDKSLRICTKKTDSAAAAILLQYQFCSNLGFWFWLDFVQYPAILTIRCHSWHVKKLIDTFIGSYDPLFLG
jgi:hypothetical protein